ncbi:ferritin, middle subunit-like [Oncorhynchus mykiss]|uniref:ferritin, middle subunit-like n=1 Tax=Oncorhynchus mykiss TaxID=8022 RepID=UPI00187794A7|nr:ferritin, middle subunit-like [Oncorhynchus mykiss]
MARKPLGKNVKQALLNMHKIASDKVDPHCIIMPDRDEWGNGLEAMQCALQLGKNVKQVLLDMHKIASDKVDPHPCDFLETHYLNEQVEAIKKLGDHITNLTKMDAVNNKMAEYLFDKHTLGGQS